MVQLNSQMQSFRGTEAAPLPLTEVQEGKRGGKRGACLFYFTLNISKILLS